RLPDERVSGRSQGSHVGTLRHDRRSSQPAITMPSTFHVRVNGAEHEVSAEPDTPLLYVLRNDLALKGTRFGCGEGQCGACMVLFDGRAVPSCDTPLWSVPGHEVTTIEGLGDARALHPIQQAFLDEQAAQCGYCINGIMMAVKALLDSNP